MEVDVCDDSRFLAGELVEVRKNGTRICWCPAKVVEARAGIRIVEYDSGGKESISLGRNSEASSRVRPRPPDRSEMCRGDWQRGLRVEAFDDSWREGLLLDVPGVFLTHVQVFFPDDGEKQEFSVDSLRVSQAWDASTNAWSGRGCGALDGVVDAGSSRFSKPQKTFQRKKKRKEVESVEPEAKKPKKEVQVKQELDGIQPEALQSGASSDLVVDVKNESLEPEWMEDSDLKPDNSRTFQPDGDGEGYCLTRTLSIPVCCINTQAEDSLFGDEHKVSEDDKVDGSCSERALCTMDSSSQGSFHSAHDVNVERNRLALSRMLKRQKVPIDYSRREESLKAARENAIKNLEESGWKKGYRERHRESRVSNEAYYISPDGTSYHSLTSACKAWMQQNKNVPKPVRDAMHSYQLQIIVRRKPGELLPDSNGGKRRLRASKKLDPSMKSKKSERPRLNALLLAPDRGKQDGGDEKANKRMSIFSWLIDGEILSEGAAVSYVNKDSNQVASGVISRDGILCKCCNEVFSMTSFQVHAGDEVHRTAALLTLEDGRSVLECQKQALKKIEQAKCDEPANGQLTVDESDECCGLCGEGGQLICCDHCPATFHLHCILLKSLPEGDWFCPRCRCPVCGAGQFDGREVLYCTQCERNYHVECLNDGGASFASSRFCSQTCRKIFCGLRELVGKTSPMDGGFSWTLLRSADLDEDADMETVTAHCSKIALALSVMRECFSPMIDPRSKIDIIAHILKNRSADVKRLDFRGFYTILLENNKDELISVAAVRVHGTSIAEMPLIGTRLQYRRQGMCRRLLEVIEQVLRSLDVHTLVLPAVPELLDTWIGAFGFQKVSPFQSVRLLELSIVGFPGTKVLQKPLTWLNLCRKIAPPLAEKPWAPGSKLHMGLEPEPRRKPKQQKHPAPKTEEISKEVRTPTPVLPEPGNAVALLQEEVPALKEGPTEDSRIVVAKTRSNRLVKTSKRVAEALKTLTNKKFQPPEDAAEETEEVENTSELSFLKLGSSHIVLDSAELGAAPTASGSEIVELASSNNETREEENSHAVVVDPKEALEQQQATPENKSDELVFLSRMKGKTCVTCGTSETPMWRKDPGGIKHLCNACGIRSKKKQHQNSTENFTWEYEEECEC
ncbi:uncharacterized protein LOC112342677 isoform X1 [Selaginella moellendorffii]|uniref:uncharacterized protein LOC112342677 isoform X1 n=1 Tax=Selaginella moellendorffii TaxID=88036 RepID=UPI000D1C9445|nr:uncharacterized protein LOC112342677 isoform X1 [Selaginella moellendorffii]|eukprot:XP_024520610.1 uncharacterized protein LOC112342677 isoform X1 [Selaginella moellendorffii]